MYDEQNEIEQRWCAKQFATHKAKLIQDTDRYFIADWRRADDSSDYYVNFIIDKKRGSIIISGDLGDCIATWYNELTPAKLCSYIRHDVRYFISKFQASSDKYVYDEDDILDDIKKHFTECDIKLDVSDDYENEEDFWEIVSDEIYNSYNNDSFHPTERLIELIGMYDSDWWEWLPYCGRRVDKRVYLWIYSLDSVLKQLGYVDSAE